MAPPRRMFTIIDGSDVNWGAVTDPIALKIHGALQYILAHIYYLKFPQQNRTSLFSSALSSDKRNFRSYNETVPIHLFR